MSLFSRKPVDPLAITLGKNTQKYIKDRESKLTAFVPTVYDKIVEKLTAVSLAGPQLTATVEIVKMFADDGDKLFAAFAYSNPKGTLPLTHDEFKTIATQVAEKLRAQKLNVEQVEKTDAENKFTIELVVAWEIPKEEPAPKVEEEKKN
jgi:hypothetical protein